MATYKGIQGYSVQKLSSDPTASEAAGQLFYNSTSGKFKVGTEGAGAWAAGNNMNTARSVLGSSGSQTAALAYGGDTGGASYQTATESFDGTDWATSPATLNSGRADLGGFGTSTATIAAGGTPGPQAETESFDGSTWTEVNDLNTARMGAGVAGTSTAGIITGGQNPPSAT